MLLFNCSYIYSKTSPVLYSFNKSPSKIFQSRPVIGDLVIGSVLRTHQRKKFKVNKGSIIRCMIIRMAENHKRKDGFRFRFQHPAAIAVTKGGLPRATKIYGPIQKNYENGDTFE